MSFTDRIKGMVLTPRAEWPLVGAEGASVRTIYLGYVAPLSAIGPVAAFVGLAAFGLGVPFLGGARYSMSTALVQMFMSYLFGLVGIFLLALLIDVLAPRFGAQSNRLQAVKVAAFSFTPAWLAGVLNIVPALGLLALLASLYSIYVMYLGLVALMKAPADKAVGYCAAVVVIAVIGAMVGGAIVGRIGLGLA